MARPPSSNRPEFKAGDKVLAFHRASNKTRPSVVLRSGAGVVVVVAMGTKSYYPDSEPPPVEVTYGSRQAKSLRLSATTYFYRNKIEAIARSELTLVEGHAPPGLLLELQKFLQRPEAEQADVAASQAPTPTPAPETPTRPSGIVSTESATPPQEQPAAAAGGEKRSRTPPPG